MTILRYSESPAVGVDFGSINSTTGKPFLLNHLRGESVSYDVSISTPIGGYGLNYGGTLKNGMSGSQILNTKNFGTGQNGYTIGSGGVSFQRPKPKVSVGAMFRKTKTWVWDF
mgnify:CR=1 FL=1